VKKHVVGLLVAALVLAFGGGLALALDDPPDPTVVEDEIVENEADETEGEETEGEETEGEESEDDESDDEESDAADTKVDAEAEGEHPENHGRYVSEAARETCAEAENHGECVREVARSDAGKPVHEDGAGEEEPAVAGASASNGKAKGKQ
jgi:hypothetical protein